MKIKNDTVVMSKEDIWNLFTVLAEINYNALVKFRKNVDSRPGSMKKMRDWKGAIDLMIFAFFFCMDHCPKDPKWRKRADKLLKKHEVGGKGTTHIDLNSPRIQPIVENLKKDGLELFAEYFEHLWD